MTHYIFDDHHHLTGFQMLFPDGEIKPAFLLTSLSALTDRDIQPKHLDRYGLRRGIDYFISSTSNLPLEVPQWHNQSPFRGRRTVLSLSGMLMMITQTRTDFGDRLFYWIYDEVVPSVMRGEPIYADNPMLEELHSVISRMGEEILELRASLGLPGYLGDLTLKDIVGTAFDIGEE